MNNEIIVVEQLPIITERLQEIKAEVTAKVNDAMSLVCTQETLAAVKKARADLNKDFKDFEERRKEVKNAIMKPYNDFDIAYKDCITDVYKKADADLKSKIDHVETALKDERAAEVKSYFEELCQASQIDFVAFENANINVTLSASLKSLKEQAKAFIDRVCDDMNLIAVQEHKDEILYLYKKKDGFSFLNVSKSVSFVIEKYRAIEAEKEREAEKQKQAEAEQKAVEKVMEVLAPPAVEEKIIKTTFTLKGTLSQLKEVKKFIIEKGIEIV